MTSVTLRKWVGYPLIAYHLLAMIGILIAGYGSLELPQRIELIFFLSPLFTVYTSSVSKVLFQSEARADQARSVDVSVFSMIIVHLFGLFINGLIVLYFLRFIDVGELRLSLGLSETLFGLYLGQIIYGLFGGRRSRRQSAVGDPAT